MFKSTKTYGHEIGLSCAFRQWRAKSHCKFLHGYALSVRLEFESNELDGNNWVVDFGSLRTFKTQLEQVFDHKTLVAKDDPLLKYFVMMNDLGLMQVNVVESCGCEKFAEMVYQMAERWLIDNNYTPRCRLVSVEIKEHGANSAIYTRD